MENTLDEITGTESKVEFAYESLIVRLQGREHSAELLLAELQRCLTKPQKALPSKFFYDAEGSRLFERIMQLEEYYPTRTETEILTENAKAMAAAMPNEPFLLVDLGSGDGCKTRILLEALGPERDFFYVPIDISPDALEGQIATLRSELPWLELKGIVGEFIQAIAHLAEFRGPLPVYTLFLGSNLGNFGERQSLSFLRNLYNAFRPGDKILLGVDMQKTPSLIKAAYDDKPGITAEFNLNMLVRLNREYGGQFDLNTFEHYATYDPLEGVARSFLVSKMAQEVFIASFNESLLFKEGETIHTENSYKYSQEQLISLACNCGFRSLEQYQDAKGYFTSVVWESLKVSEIGC
jgi:L-histidine Nalpha-methyltransferase